MKLSDFLSDIGRPVAFYPGLVKALGSMKQAVFVCQMAYWKGKGSDPDGWIYKTSEEIETETSLTYKEQTTARAALVKMNALEERYARTEHQMYFRVNWDVVNSLWDEHITKEHMPKGKVASDQQEDGILPKVSSLNSNTETTAETTTKKAAKAALTKEEMGEALDGVEMFVKMSEPPRGFWAGRELIPEYMLPFADWWNAQTNLTMKGKVNKEWLKAFKEWYEEQLSINSLQQAFDHIKAWKKIISKPSEITETAKAINAGQVITANKAQTLQARNAAALQAMDFGD